MMINPHGVQRKDAPPELPEIWRDIADTGGRYQVSTHGRVRRMYDDKPPLILKLRPHHNGGMERVTLTLADGRRIDASVLRLVAEAFLRVPPGATVAHRNGLHSDNRLTNIVFMSRRQLGVRYGHMARRRPVKKIDRAGRVLEYFPSVAEAARAGHFSPMAVRRRCQRQIADEYAPYGYTYRYDGPAQRYKED